MIASLIICTLLYVLMSGVLTGIRKYTDYLAIRGRRDRHGRDQLAQALVSAGALAGMTSVLLVFQLGQTADLWHGARGLLPQYSTPPFTLRTPTHHHLDGVIVGGVAMLTDIGSLADLTNIGTIFAFAWFALGVILRRTDPNPAAPSGADGAAGHRSSGFMCVALRLSLPICLAALFRLARPRDGDLFLLQHRHSRLQHGVDVGPTEDILPPRSIRSRNRALRSAMFAFPGFAGIGCHRATERSIHLAFAKQIVETEAGGKTWRARLRVCVATIPSADLSKARRHCLRVAKIELIRSPHDRSRHPGEYLPRSIAGGIARLARVG